jgi:hypothetical protein
LRPVIAQAQWILSFRMWLARGQHGHMVISPHSTFT